MDPISSKTALAAAGAAGEEALYVDDVFSTYLYDGTGAAQTITNGIDLSGEGGMVWIKERSNADSHALFDTERGVQKYVKSDASDSQYTRTDALSAFNSDGFSFNGAFGAANQSSQTYASWTFRKAPGFFDVVTYTGDGTNGRDISHNLGSAPGMIVYKALSSVGGDGSGDDWWVDHRSLPSTKSLRLNTGVAEQSNKTYWTESKRFDADALNVNGNVNQSGINYVAYIFAHDDQSFGANGDEAIIKCGSYSGTGSAGNDINVGFEPQFIITKNTTSTNEWFMYDSMRIDENGDQKRLNPSTSGAELTTADPGMKFNATGFTPIQNNNNKSGQTFIYIAIRRPHKPPEAATDVFAANVETEVRSTSGWTSLSGFVTDAFMNSRNLSSEKYTRLSARLTGGRFMYPDSNSSEGATNYYGYDTNDGIKEGPSTLNSSSDKNIDYHFRRAPGFFDVVTYTGGGGNIRSHNLGAVPKLMFIKCRSSSQEWAVYAEPLGNNKSLVLNSNGTGYSGVITWDSTTPTSTTFAVSGFGVNSSGQDYVAYLFGDLDGVSKVGSYTGTGAAQNIDCGFTNGARFVLIKRTDSTGDWYVWDSTRGIVSGNDPYIELNSTDSEVTNTDYLDPLNAGFTVTSSAPAALNTSGGTYLFLAIA